MQKKVQKLPKKKKKKKKKRTSNHFKEICQVLWHLIKKLPTDIGFGLQRLCGGFAAESSVASSKYQIDFEQVFLAIA